MKTISYKKYHRDEDYLIFEKHFKNIFMKRFLLMNQFVKRGRILDIGSSTGTMLSVFKEHGWETWGVEPSESAQSAKSKGHKIINNYFEKAKLPANFFDAVIANHTLEHMDDPLLVLKKVYRLLKKGGIVFIDVPNAGGLGSKILGEKWPYRAPEEHKHQFTRQSLASIFEKAGFKIVHFESRSGIFEFANPILECLDAILTLKKRIFRNLLFLPYDIVVTAFQMGDSMSMIGKKK